MAVTQYTIIEAQGDRLRRFLTLENLEAFTRALRQVGAPGDTAIRPSEMRVYLDADGQVINRLQDWQ